MATPDDDVPQVHPAPGSPQSTAEEDAPAVPAVVSPASTSGELKQEAWAQPDNNPLNPIHLQPNLSKLSDGSKQRQSVTSRRSSLAEAVDDIAEALGDALNEAWNKVDDVGAAPEGVSEEWNVTNSLSSPDWQNAMELAQTNPVKQMFLTVLAAWCVNIMLTATHSTLWFCVYLPARVEDFDNMTSSEKWYSVPRNSLLNNLVPLGFVCVGFCYLPWLDSPDRAVTLPVALRPCFAVTIWATLCWVVWIALDVDTGLVLVAVSGIMTMVGIGRTMRVRNKAGWQAVWTSLAAVLSSFLAVFVADVLLRNFDSVPSAYRPIARMFLQACAAASNYVAKRAHRVVPARVLPATVSLPLVAGSVGYACSSLLAIVIPPVDTLQSGGVSLVCSVLWKATSERRARPRGVHGETERFHFQWCLTNQLDLFMEANAFLGVFVAVCVYSAMPASEYPIPKFSNMVLCALIIMLQQLLDYSLSAYIMTKYKNPVRPLFAYCLVRQWTRDDRQRLVLFCLFVCSGALLAMVYVPAALRVGALL